jgi:hypothetical protein
LNQQPSELSWREQIGQGREQFVVQRERSISAGRLARASQLNTTRDGMPSYVNDCITIAFAGQVRLSMRLRMG